ncbi:MAG: hybrid-cluster NAD(P)-dependent oxidoreductase [Sandaracinaceae bacterium]|nr:hybrid-cluster NAD(P)-dependent oxidoreductase [Sandaracinaceae bacterium]MBP7681349.1 hybrid-cluster NAD(P)-dependent oxidoreductase [Deltaproteobacteria bacterium]MBK7155153.1 hybrid-cluster NAD(P)-dependent oxidoreductase [Sandaracinaceae bacterium]MBK7776241.1 hybrid-cluster NAD(P)-dependent oxidoreductase [Sandaracinaceae bacterium]MBK8409065.1 hybrid-cluster NAD(P)-dependent oxidoreductase [Sandaracinaceae bacterium]
MTRSPLTGPALDLPFALLLWVAGADDEIDAHEVEVFHKLCADRSWCGSAFASEALAHVDAGYGELWAQHRAGTFDASVRALRVRYQDAAVQVPLGERALLRADLARLGLSLARASGGFLGIGSVSRRERAALALLDALADELLPSVAVADDVAQLGRVEAPCETPVWDGGRIVVRCVQVIPETHDCTTFRFVPEHALHFRYAPGQFLCMELSIDGQPVRRSYTIASTPTRPDALEVTVKRVPGGLVSNWLNDHMRPGEPLIVTGCAGHFTCARSSAEKLLMISAGSGITPVMSMARWLHDRGDPRDVVFVHSARGPRDVIFQDELRLLEQRHPSFRTALTFTRDVPADWEGPRGRVDAALLSRVAPDWMDRHIFLCGPEPFMEAVRDAVHAAGFPMAHYAAESFGASREKAQKVTGRTSASALRRMLPEPLAWGPQPSPLRAPRPTDAGPAPRPATRSVAPQVVFAGTPDGPCEVCCDDTMTLLEAAESVGVDLPFACRSGVCGTCRIRVQGETELPASAGLSESDRAAGFTLACVARPRGHVRVDL